MKVFRPGYLLQSIIIEEYEVLKNQDKEKNTLGFKKGKDNTHPATEVPAA